MKKIFAISALSLAISTAATGVQAEECVVAGGDGASLKEWGIWCGVDTLLSALTAEEPSAAGPEAAELNLGIDGPAGRNEADEFEPELEPEPEPDLVPLHVLLPTADEGQFVGYFAEVEGYGDAMMNGGFSLALTDGDGEGNGYGGPVAALDENEGDPDIVTYARFNPDGTPVDGATYSSVDDYSSSDASGSENTHTRVSLASEGDIGYFSHNEYRYDNGYGDAPRGGRSQGIFGGEVYVYQEFEQDGQPQSISQQSQVLKDYWAGYTYESQYNDDSHQNTNGPFVAGITTPLDDLDQLIAGDVVAAYSGDTMRGQQRVRIDVDFGAERFNSEFGDVNMYAKDAYGIERDVDLSFTASGVVQGIHLISDQISADAGYVQGTFFGAGAEIIGGTLDVTIDDNRFVDVFTAVEGENNRIDGSPQ